MTVSNLDYRAGPYHNGSDEGQNLFNFYFKVFFKEDVRVVLKSALGVESDLVLDSDYSVTMNGDQDNNPGGYVSTEDSYPFDAVRTITVVSNIPELQGTALPNGTGWNPRVVENGLDKAMLIPHQLHGFMDRCIRFPISEEELPVVELPSKENRANTTIGFDANGDLIVTSGFLPGAVIVSTFGEALVGAANADAALDELGFSALTKSLVPVTDENTYLTLLGGGTSGIQFFQSETINDIQLALGISPFMATTLTSADPAALFASMGFSAFGEAWVQLPSLASAQAALGFDVFGAVLLGTATLAEAQTALDISLTGADIINSPTVSDAQTALGISPFFKTLLDDADPAEVLTSLGLAGIFSPRGHIDGLTMSNSAGDPVNDIDIAPGEATDSTQTDVMTLAGMLTKQLDALWALGSSAGGRDAGALADGWWHVFLIRRSDTGETDALFSLSPTAPTLPASYDQGRRIGSVLRAAGTLVQFRQVGDEFVWAVPRTNVSLVNPGIVALTATLDVPTGVIVRAYVTWGITHGAGTNTNMLVTALNQTDTAPTTTMFSLKLFGPGGANAGETNDVHTFTNSLGQVRHRQDASAAAHTTIAVTKGWTDARGRHG